MNAIEPSPLVYIWVDESCLGNQFSDKPRPGAAAGMIEVFDDQRGWTRRDYYVSDAATTNNRMALRSAIEGLSSLTRASRVVFYSDSRYLVQGMKDWVHTWAERGWTRKEGPIVNLELWQKLSLIAHGHAIEWRWVPGHAGEAKNEYVHHLATTAAKNQKISGGLVDSGFGAWLEAQQNKEQFLEFLDVPPDQPFAPDPSPPKPPQPR